MKLKKKTYFCSFINEYFLMKKIVIALVMTMAMNIMAQSVPVAGSAKDSLTTSTARLKASAETRALMQTLLTAKSVSALPTSMRNLYPVTTIRKIETIGVLAKVDDTFSPTAIAEIGGSCTSRLGNVVSMRLPVSALDKVENVKGIIYYSVAHSVAPMVDNARFDTRADSVQKGLGLPQAFDGTDVLIGITDWGFDYKHPNLTKKKNPRIERAWDQFRLSGPAPNGFTYGTEIVGHDALKAAGGDTSNIYDYGTHATHVSGIAGGNGTSDSLYIGMAPNAHFLMGSFLLDEASWVDEVYWMHQVAKESGKRLVINSSWGMYSFSNLDGTSLLSQAINSLSDSGVVFVTSGGNNGDCNFHIGKTFGNNDTLKTVASWYSYSAAVGQCLIMWGSNGQGNILSLPFSVQFAMSKDSTVFYSDWISTTDFADPAKALASGAITLLDGDTCHWWAIGEAVNPNDGRPHIQLNVGYVNGYTLHLIIASDSNSRVDAWNVVNLQNYAGNMGADFVDNGEDGYLAGDNAYGIGEPGCAAKTITVAAHHADRVFGDSTCHHGNIANFSSRGPAFGDYAKPEISAPSVGVVSSISSRSSEHYDYIHSVYTGGTVYGFAAMSGTSMSSPAVTGIVALMLDANPNLSVDQIREILFLTARNDTTTGHIHSTGTPSDIWGWGKANALRAVAMAYDRLDVNEAEKHVPQLVLFPNPAENQVEIVTTNMEPETLNIFSISGQLVKSQQVNNGETISLQGLPSGVYIVNTIGKLGIRTQKMVIK